MKENILVLVRATPEKSRKHSHLVCVAGINDNNEWRRLYPVKFSYGDALIDFNKRDMIQATLANPDNDKRLESRKVIGHNNLNSQMDTDAVRERILPLVTSIEKLSAANASLGVIKPELLGVNIEVNSTDIYDNQTYFSIAGDYLSEKREKVKMPVKLSYHFKCKGEPECNGHNIVLIDWELNELTRNIIRKDKDPKIVEEKIRVKFFDNMKERDLYFYMGTHFRFKTWIIIGIFYPKQRTVIEEKTVQKTLFDV